MAVCTFNNNSLSVVNIVLHLAEISDNRGSYHLLNYVVMLNMFAGNCD